MTINGVYPPSNSSYATAVGLPNGHVYLMGGQATDGTRLDENWLFTDLSSAPVLMAPMTRKLSQSCAVLVDDTLIFYVAGSSKYTTGNLQRMEGELFVFHSPNRSHRRYFAIQHD